MYQTTVQAVGNLAGIHYGLSVLGSNASADTSNVAVRNLSVDMNWGVIGASADTGSGSEKNIKLLAITISGSHTRIEHVAMANSYGSFANGQESFWCFIGCSPATATVTDNIVTDVTATSPNGTYSSPFAFGGSTGHIISNSAFRNCSAYGTNDGNDALGFRTGGVNAAFIQDCEVSGCLFSDCGELFYQDTGSTDGIKIFNNRGIRLAQGIQFVEGLATTKQRVEIYGNTIELQNRNDGQKNGITVIGATTDQVAIYGNIIYTNTAGSGYTGNFFSLYVTAATNGSVTNNICDNVNALCVGVLLRNNRTPAGGVLTGGVDGPTNKDKNPLFINLNTGSPVPTAYAGSVFEFAGIDATPVIGTLDSFGAGSALLARRANGTSVSKTTLVSGNLISALSGLGWDGTAYAAVGTGSFQIFSGETWGTTAHGTYASVFTTPLTTVTLAETARFQPSGGASFGSTVVATDPGNGVGLFGKA